MEIRVIKAPFRAISIPNLNLPTLKLRQAGAAFAAGSRRLNRIFNYQKYSLIENSEIIYGRKIKSNYPGKSDFIYQQKLRNVFYQALCSLICNRHDEETWAKVFPDFLIWAFGRGKVRM